LSPGLRLPSRAEQCSRKRITLFNALRRALRHRLRACPRTTDGQQTDNRRRTTDNGQQTTDNRRPTTNDHRRPASDHRQTTGWTPAVGQRGTRQSVQLWANRYKSPINPHGFGQSEGHRRPATTSQSEVIMWISRGGYPCCTLSGRTWTVHRPSPRRVSTVLSTHTPTCEKYTL